MTIEPAAARSAGAQWKLTSGFDTDWKDSADTITDLPAGSYTITFKEVSGWTRPADISVNITAGTLETRTGTYVGQAWTNITSATAQALAIDGGVLAGSFDGLGVWLYE